MNGYNKNTKGGRIMHITLTGNLGSGKSAYDIAGGRRGNLCPLYGVSAGRNFRTLAGRKAGRKKSKENYGGKFAALLFNYRSLQATWVIE